MLPSHPLDRLATRVLERIGLQLWGFRPRLMSFIVKDRGASSALAWFVTNMPRYETTLAREGAWRTHLWCTAISLENGCAYCTYGHAFALELVHLRDTGEPFAIKEDEFVALVNAEPAERRTAMKSAVINSGIDPRRTALDTLYKILDGATPENRTERRMTHLISMFAVLNMCGRTGCVRPDEAHDPINKDQALKLRYQALRTQH